MHERPGPANNAFKTDKPGTIARSGAEAEIQELSEQGGVFVEAVRATRMPMVVTTPSLPGNPIVFANEAFLELSGYSMAEVLGQQPHFMNGANTDDADAANFRKALAEDRDEVIESVQYRRDGSSFVASVFLSAFKGPDGGTLHQFLSYFDVTPRVAAEQELVASQTIQAELSASQDRQAFLLALSDTLRPLADPVEIQAEAARLLGEQLGSGRACYVEVDAQQGEYVGARDWREPGETSHLGAYRLEDWPMPWLDKGRTWVVRDTARDAGLSPAQRDAYRGNDIGAAIVVPLLKGGRLVATFLTNQRAPRDWTAAEISLVEQTAERTWSAVERARAEAALRASDERFQQFARATPDVLWIRNADSLVMEYVSPAFETVYGAAAGEVLGEGIGKWAALIHPDDRQAAADALQRVRAGHDLTHEFRVVGPTGETHWIENTDFPLHDSLGQVQRIGGLARDVTAAKQSAERQRLLLAELQHRVRNILATVRSLARRTMRSAETVEEAADHFDGRLDALARTQALLTRTAGAGVNLEQLVQEELLAQHPDDDNIIVEGPPLNLSPKAAEILTLAVHELATNATKYGAFANPMGSLVVRWAVEPAADDRSLLRLTWEESGVPMVARAPRRLGFGTELIEKRVPYELKGDGKIQLLPGGLRAEISFPLVPGESILATSAPAGLLDEEDDA